MRKKIVAGNWKMNLTLKQAIDLVEELKKNFHSGDKVEVVVAPSFPYLYPLREILKASAIELSAQNMHWETAGAFTGEVSAPMLLSVGIDRVILGHSERRQYFCEDAGLLAKKVKTAMDHEMQVIFCVGEVLEEREAGRHFDTVREQLEASLHALTPADWSRMTIAYEPVWAIGTGKTATPDQAQEMHRFIRQVVSGMAGEQTAEQIRILYGGSVKPSNAADLFSRPDVDGGLVGGASLKPEDFLAIIEAAL